MWDRYCCDICGNETSRMSDTKRGCLSCYTASGPDWVEQWLWDCQVAIRADAAAARRAASNVLQFADWKILVTTKSVEGTA